MCTYVSAENIEIKVVLIYIRIVSGCALQDTPVAHHDWIL